MKKIGVLILALIMLTCLTACSSSQAATNSAGSQSQLIWSTATLTEEKQISGVMYTSIEVDYDAEDLDSGVSSEDMSFIILNGDWIAFKGSGAQVSGSRITITSGGLYSVSGTLKDGQIIINTSDRETVKLVLNGADITCSTGAPIYIMEADKTIITLALGTSNFVIDGDSYVLEEAGSDEPDAAIYSKGDLTINGSGSLTVEGNYRHGISSEDDLFIVSGSITVNAVGDGIKGKDCIVVKDGSIKVRAGSDGLQSSNTVDPERGYIAIEGGFIEVTAGTDGIQAETQILISGGNISITSGGGSGNSSSNKGQQGNTWGAWGNSDNKTSTASAKGLKAGVTLTISGGTLDINSSDDAVHSNGSISISGGKVWLSSGDDGIHADASLTVNCGEINVTKSYEGLESAEIIINEGNIHVAASDDGINVAGGSDGSSMGSRPGQNNFVSSGSNYLTIKGGYVYVDALGDGIDVNGPITMSAGRVIVNGPTSDGNGALDYTGSFKMTGGFLAAAGSSGMAQAPSTSSTQYSVIMTYSTMQAASTLVHIVSHDGQEILTFAPTKAYQSVVICSSSLTLGATYSIYSGGSASGEAIDGLYTGGSYTAGTQVASFSISGMVTAAGATRGGVPGGVGAVPAPGRMRP